MCFTSKPYMGEQGISVSVLAAALLAPAGSAMTLFSQIDPVKHHPLSRNYHPLSKVMFLIIRFFRFAGKDDLYLLLSNLRSKINRFNYINRIIVGLIKFNIIVVDNSSILIIIYPELRNGQVYFHIPYFY